MKRYVTAAALGCLVANAGLAAPVEVFETRAPGGDYADALGASTNMLGVFPVGTATITGNLSAPRDLFDAFFFTIEAGSEMITSEITTEGSDVTMLAELFDANGDTIFTKTFSTNGTTDLLTLADAPVGEGTYNMGLSFIPTSDDDEVSWFTASEAVALPVSAVPLPAGAPLMLAGLAALAALRRRKSARANPNI